jgi:mRNA interferase HicA
MLGVVLIPIEVHGFRHKKLIANVYTVSIRFAGPPQIKTTHLRILGIQGRLLDNRTFWTDNKNVKGAEFLRRVKRLAHDNGVEVRLVPHRGKGSHATLYFGAGRTILQDLKRELPTGTLHAMLKQLGLTLDDLE